MLEILGTYYDEDGEPVDVRWQKSTAACFRYPYFYEDKPISVDNVPYHDQPLIARNYRLFAMLADVRNGVGFAGVDTGDRIRPIDQPRGVPDDASLEWTRYVDSWGEGLHSTTYLTLTDLLAYDFDGLIFVRGYVEESVYLQLRGTNETPQGWSGGIGGGGITTFTALEYESLSLDELRTLREQAEVFPHGGVYVQYQWAMSKRECMGELAEVIEVMRASCPRPWDAAKREYGAPRTDDIRIMVGFDS